MPKILVVDDSAADRTLVSGLLERQPEWLIRQCVNGREALDTLRAPLPDLVVTDLQMPEMDGLELVRSLKEDWPFIPVILLTARGSEDIAAQALRAGAASYVPKHRLGRDLVETIRRVLTAVAADESAHRLHHYLDSSHQTLRLRNDPSQIGLLTLHVQQQLRCLPLGDETERLRVSLAFEEALKNACLHGNLELNAPASLDRPALLQAIQSRAAESPFAERMIHVDLMVDRAAATFVVRDDGRGFDHRFLLQSAVLDDQEQASCRGLALMRTIFDEVRYNESGNKVTLVKRGISPETVADDEE
ncbi:MAG: response regulator [Planctomycetaceae bacterium]|nr:response regulator [Planctomycetaceae bacterium]